MKRVKVVASDETFSGLVVGNDPNIGVTIVNADNRDHYLICIHGPLTKRYKQDGFSHKKELFEVAYKVVNDMIDLGVIDYDVFEEKLNSFNLSFGNNPSSKTCPFNQ